MMHSFHFAHLLSDDERVLWSGQPVAKAFEQEEQRIMNFIIWLLIGWTLVFGISAIWRHGLPYSYTHGRLAIAVSGLILAALVKIVSSFGISRAGDQWYTITSKRLFVELPDEGSQTIIIVNLADVKTFSFRLNKANRDADIGTMKITTATKTNRERSVYLSSISDISVVCHILEQVVNQ